MVFGSIGRGSFQCTIDLIDVIADNDVSLTSLIIDTQCVSVVDHLEVAVVVAGVTRLFEVSVVSKAGNRAYQLIRNFSVVTLLAFLLFEPLFCLVAEFSKFFGLSKNYPF